MIVRLSFVQSLRIVPQGGLAVQLQNGAVKAPPMMREKARAAEELLVVRGEEVTMAKEPRVTGLVGVEVELPRVEMVEAVVVEAVAEPEMNTRPAMSVKAEVVISN